EIISREFQRLCNNSSSWLNSCLLIDTTATAHLPRPRAQGEWRPHDHHRELRAWRRTARPALAQSRARHRDAMTLVTTSSYCTPAGEPRFRPCTIVAPPPPKPPLTPSIRPRSPSRPPPRRQSRHRNRRSATTPASASPTQAVARPNSLRGRPPTRRPAGSFLGGFRTPALRAHTNRYDGPVSETLHQEQPMLRLVAARSRRRGRSLWRARTARPGRAIARPGATNRLSSR